VRTATGPVPATALGAADTDLAHRVRALSGPPPRPRPVLSLTVAALVLVTAAAAVDTAHTTERRIERAQAAAGLRPV
jgi:hypothetical protein